MLSCVTLHSWLYISTNDLPFLGYILPRGFLSRQNKDFLEGYRHYKDFLFEYTPMPAVLTVADRTVQVLDDTGLVPMELTQLLKYFHING